MQRYPARTQHAESGGRLTVESVVAIPWNEWFFSVEYAGVASAFTNRGEVDATFIDGK